MSGLFGSRSEGSGIEGFCVLLLGLRILGWVWRVSRWLVVFANNMILPKKTRQGDVRRKTQHLLSFLPEDPRPPLGYIVRVENMEAQHIHHPNVADDPAELRAVEAALDVHITPVIPATSGEPAAPGSSRLTSPEHDDLESFGRGPPPPLPVNRPPSGEPPASAPARGDALTPHPVLAALAKAGALG